MITKAGSTADSGGLLEDKQQAEATAQSKASDTDIHGFALKEDKQGVR